MTPEILYEDNHLLVVVKPPNLPVQADASGDADLLSVCKAYIKEKYNKPGEVYLGLVHRLDRPAGGVVALARTSKAAARLSAQFRGHGTLKRYVALTAGDPAPRARLEDDILREGSTSRLAPGDPNAQGAMLSYETVAQAGGLSLLDVRLFTGRHHQIRVQLAGRGLPLWGDQRYNPAARPGQQLALWAYSLTFEHPTLHTRLTCTSLPQGPAWQPFMRQLTALAAGFSIVYEDENLFVFNKPAGLETAAADGGEASLEARASAIFGPLYPVHRLDANTTGLVLFAKTRAAESALGEALRARTIRKYYRCTVKGRPAPQATLTGWLLKDERAGRVAVYDREVPGAKPIATAYETLTCDGEQAELLVELQTGRTHQIRAHLAHIGHPLLGDDKYGEREWNRARKTSLIRLCAVRLVFDTAAPEGPLAALAGKTLAILAPWEEC